MMMMMLMLLVVITLLLSIVSSYKIGQGIYDITGPAVEVNFMGYAVPDQRGQGIHTRLRARSFVISDNSKTIAIVIAEIGMGSDLVKSKVISSLNQKIGSDVFSNDNVAISGTHTHSGPAGFLQYVLFQLTTFGFVKETFDAVVNGIVESIYMAYQNAVDADINVAIGKLYDANINRSPTSYLLNPEEERLQYEDGDTDKDMLLLKFTSADNKNPIGVLNWFAVHGTSMNNTNTLISADNKGYAAYAMEKHVNGPDSLPGRGPFVAAFAPTNLGDVSPNTQGAKCIDTGLPCEPYTSTCNGRSEKCIAFGPGKDMTESCKIIGDKQFEKAKALMDEAVEEVSGPIDYRHTFVDMSRLNATLSNGDSVTLCSPAMGNSFASGTTDGPGMFNFIQGDTTPNPFWNKVSFHLSTPTDDEMKCQSPKPILLNTGDVEKPYQWDPRIVPVQLFRVGNLFIANVPSEFTTMSGRRMRAAIKKVIEDANIITDKNIYVTISGLSNTYSSYVTTNEEYQAQRYEAASTIFGPNTLSGYIQEFTKLASDMVKNVPSPVGPPVPDLLDVQIQLMPEPHADRTPKDKRFGDAIVDADSSYNAGSTVSVTFQAANPRHNQKIQGSFLTVEKLQTDNTFSVVATDGDWNTKFFWLGGKDDKYDFGFSHLSTATLSWDIPTTAQGTFKICYHGDAKHKDTIIPFTGCSTNFEVVANQ